MIIPAILEGIGIGVIMLGIAIELQTGAAVGHITISSGACLVAIGSMIWGKFLKRG